MVFYNHCLSSEKTLSAIIALPFTVHTVNKFSPRQLFLLAKFLGLKSTFEGLNTSSLNIIK